MSPKGNYYYYFTVILYCNSFIASSIKHQASSIKHQYPLHQQHQQHQQLHQSQYLKKEENEGNNNNYTSFGCSYLCYVQSCSCIISSIHLHLLLLLVHILAPPNNNNNNNNNNNSKRGIRTFVFISKRRLKVIIEVQHDTFVSGTSTS